MSPVLALKLVGIFVVIAIGWTAGRWKALGPEAATVLNRAAFTVFAPALLFRTTSAISVDHLPWTTLAAYFVPTFGVLLCVYLWQRHTRPAGAEPTIRALSVSFSNTVQVGIPVVTALFGEPGLAVLVSIISLQALLLLTTGTVLAESDLAREGRQTAGPRIGGVVRRSLIHPVVLPILLGLAYNTTGLPMPKVIGDVLSTLGSAVVPVSLVTIGLTLQVYGRPKAVAQAVALSAGKLVLQPATVLAVAYLVFGLTGLPLVVAVLCAALPTGANVLLFAGRYESLHGETAAVIVLSTLAFGVIGTLWVLLLTQWPSAIHS